MRRGGGPSRDARRTREDPLGTALPHRVGAGSLDGAVTSLGADLRSWTLSGSQELDWGAPHGRPGRPAPRWQRGLSAQCLRSVPPRAHEPGLISEERKGQMRAAESSGPFATRLRRNSTSLRRVKALRVAIGGRPLRTRIIDRLQRGGRAWPRREPRGIAPQGHTDRSGYTTARVEEDHCCAALPRHLGCDRGRLREEAR
jgi:hypothetical protein